MAQNKRIVALDVLRGITIAGMILVNNPGSWGHIYAPLKHAAWDGCTPTDLVFPFFMFCMGVAMYISNKKNNYTLNWKTVGHMAYRGALIVLIGWALSWFGIFMRNFFVNGETFCDAIWNIPVHHLRWMGVFPRLGIVSFFAGLLLLIFKPKRAPWVAGVLMIGYCILISVTNSFELTAENILARVDLACLGDAHMYHKDGLPFDPEGLLSTIPCFAHCLLGAFAGFLLFPEYADKEKEALNNYDRINRLFIFAAIILLAGFCLDYAYPINKSMWSASYVLVTCGLASLLLGLLIWIIDIRGHKRWSMFFESFGVNPLFIFCLSAIFVHTMGAIRFEVNGEMYSVWSAYYRLCMVPLFGETGGSLASALTLDGVLWLIAHPLYTHKIYIKI